ncbi:hypothetical protein TRFO_04367 [Tritrichomonas foetus]|uniref:Pyrroline-5-carboxylate reductase catalytic N-terminal domain-containing protein n=1 Tax=Tritrichomonas foetus TaxID=1144522 RepID=A0A1J4KFY0_9EUKA|nr:hypothetical protein TRFO_04367 [Tritrichomonas foetus]|eukprot:OHT09848.1 hypothetical protein TRFO_04367 [Tritrichomonas foetus]
MSSYRYTEEEIEELCRIPPWTDSSLDKQTKRIHDQVPLTRKCIVNQCLFWCDVARRFKKNMHSKKAAASHQEEGDSNNNLGTPNDPTFIVGVIGCGSVGSKFVRELVKREIVKPNQIKISSRTPSRAKQRCGLEVIPSNTEIASHCTILFLFVLPFHFRNFSREIRDAIQGSRPLVVSSLAGFTPMYLQRALNTPFLITTGVDMPTIQNASEHLDEEFPLASFASGDELVHFQEYFMGMFEAGGNGENPSNLLQTSRDDENRPKSSNDTSVSAQPSNTSVLSGQKEHQIPPQPSENNLNPFQIKLTDPKLMRQLHEASFAAENLSNCGFDFLTSTINALKDWVSLDSNYAKIQSKPETYNNLWTRSFIPLSSLNRVEAIQTSGSVEQQMPVRYMLKRAFVRSLIGNKLADLKHQQEQSKIANAIVTPSPSII